MSKLIVAPFPADMSLVKVAQREGSKPAQTVAKLRAFSAPFTVRDGEEESTTTAKGNSGHNIPLNAAQYAVISNILATLRGSDKKARAALIETLRNDGGIALPVNHQGRTAATGESIADLFGDL